MTVLAIQGRASVCWYRPHAGHGSWTSAWRCQVCQRISSRPVPDICPLIKENIMKSQFGLDQFMRASSEPGTLYLLRRGKSDGPRPTLCWVPLEPPHSWVPAIWRPTKIWTSQRVTDRSPQALLASITDTAALRFHLDPEQPLLPCRTRGTSRVYEIFNPAVGMVTTKVLHRRPGGEIS